MPDDFVEWCSGGACLALKQAGLIQRQLQQLFPETTRFNRCGKKWLIVQGKDAALRTQGWKFESSWANRKWPVTQRKICRTFNTGAPGSNPAGQQGNIRGFQFDDDEKECRSLISGVGDGRIAPMEEQRFEAPPVQVRVLLRPLIRKKNALLSL